MMFFLENVYYKSFGKIFDYIQQNIFEEEALPNQVVEIGFWPGGDRDGNPFVTPETTLKVSRRLRQTILKNYYRDIRKLRRRLTFRGIEDRLQRLEKSLYTAVFEDTFEEEFTLEFFREELETIKALIIQDHQSLFLSEINSFINKVQLFGFHFATLDIRQDSRVHHKVFTAMVDLLLKDGGSNLPSNYHELSEDEQVTTLSNIAGTLTPEQFEDEDVANTIATIQILKKMNETRLSDYVFPGMRPKAPLSNMAFAALLKRMKYGHITTHGFRSTFRDWAAESTAYPNEVCEQALAHTIANRNEAAYRRGGRRGFPL